MKLSDMTDSLFDKEMMRILGDVQFWCIRLDNIGKFTLTPTPVSYGDGLGKQPFPLALELKRVWDYARGDAKRPEEMHDIIQSLCELLWSHIGGSAYEIPAEFWDRPLGFMIRAAQAREALEYGEDLTAEQVAILSELTHGRIKQLCQSGELPAEKVDSPRTSRGEWIISAQTVRDWLEKRK